MMDYIIVMLPMMPFLKNILIIPWSRLAAQQSIKRCISAGVLVADLFIVICDAVSLVYAGIAPANHA